MLPSKGGLQGIPPVQLWQAECVSLACILGKGVRLDGPEARASDAPGAAIYQGALLCLKRAIALRVFGMDGERPVNTA